MYKKNEYYNVQFEDLTHDGAGVAKVDGFPIFVQGALPDEKGKIKVIKVKKGFAFGRLMELTEQSKERQDAPCPIYKQCGGCQLQHLSYQGQLDYKQKQVKDVLKRIGKLDLEKVKVHPTLGMEDPWNYRNKAQVPVGEREGGLVAGFYQQRSHEIINMERCLIQQAENDHVVQAVKEICERFGIKAYDEKKHKGWLRHIIVRYGYVSGQMMLVFVTKTSDFPHTKALLQEITSQFSMIRSIVQNVNSKRTNVIFGEETNVLFGSEYIYDKIGDIEFAISARSFYQVNPEQTRVLYDKALEYAELTGEESVIDAYCGIGTISLFLAQKAKQVFGVEIVPEAIEDAKRNAELNGMSNAEFAVGQAEEVIPTWYKEGNKAEVIVVDPPRKGCDEALLQTIIDMKPKRVVYVSCNPSTLARDLHILEQGGFETKEVQPVDMFPHTSHVETVALIELK
ncbi:23S rRNA (uracil(1939)-C(5))-methyltransferase RlmD [Bacillus carboniphilus]|uniref:23S rRNA (Uracil(1939)-C(5))-methyltransferase RlmD n=1 Tax=Bacillus carboniphilus TaxID=86663 RepID=A0ABY9JY83_9BACI|nr:23S rRNA (uracil(1939)-C(5))-methyltransferase RlmD [Bacillus carboniphilus]WLR44364.1 23S rRNA (uracil(1939)-C(5))-methyltransferase RlmD [Bacillus carboniphilus]